MKKLGLISLVVVLVATVGLFMMSLRSKSDIVYIKIPEVYQSFQMTTDLENLFNRELEVRKGKIDQLKLQIDTSNTADTELLQKLYSQYELMSKRLYEFKNRKSEEIQNQSLGRISELAMKYGDEKGYRFILGANGNGAIMHASKEDDVTAEFIEYLNQEYATTTQK